MKLTKEQNYALLVMKCLAGSPAKFVSLHEIAQDHRVSAFFLKTIAHKLKRARLIKAKEGAAGGYRLAASAKEINLAEILDAVREKSKRGFDHIFLEIDKEISAHYEKVSLSSLVSVEMSDETVAKRQVYLDHAAATYLDPRVKQVMEPYWENNFGNPSSLYRVGRKAKKALEESRKTIAHILHSQPSELIFTGSGTESDNLAILGVCKAWEEAETHRLAKNGEKTALTKKRHLITSAIEHHAVLYAFQQLEKQGYDVTYLPVDGTGLVDPADLRAALRDDTLLVSIMYANNEVGTIQPIQELAAICKRHNVLFHTDACQAAGTLPLDVNRLGVDLMTLNASKIYGPKGVGLLYVRQGTRIKPLVYGGGQEKGLRSGTENIPGIVGFAKALELAVVERDAENKRLTQLRDYFVTELQQRLPDLQLNGHPTKRLPNNANISLVGIEAEAFLLMADEVGIACATGSACDSAAHDPSHVLSALGLSSQAADSAVRFTLGRRTSKTDLEYVIKETVSIVQRLRK